MTEQTVFGALGVEEPKREVVMELSSIGLKHFMEKDYTRSDEVLDLIKAHGFKPTDENKILVASSIAYGASVGDIDSKMKQVFDK